MISAIIVNLVLISDVAIGPSESLQGPIEPVDVTATKIEVPPELRARFLEKLERELRAHAEDLKRKRDHWDSLNITNYEYIIDFHGGFKDTPPIHVVVRSGIPQSAESDGIGTIALTIPQVFESVASTLAAARANLEPRIVQVRLVFDSAYGFPVRFEFFDSNTGGGLTDFEIAQFLKLQ